jgi:hypothetical protein
MPASYAYREAIFAFVCTCSCHKKFMNLRTFTAWVGLAAAAVLATGCQSSETPQVVSAEPVAIEQVASAETATTAPTEPTPAAGIDGAMSANSVTVTPFNPPFPDRLEPFEPPKGKQGTVRRDEEHGASVELKGFVNVDQPRVVLSIDGVVSPIPQGGEKYGVQVISIQPPSVVLQRGRARWTATLE